MKRKKVYIIELKKNINMKIEYNIETVDKSINTTKVEIMVEEKEDQN